jgi:hypothetical protein
MPRPQFHQSRKKFVRQSILFRNSKEEELNLALIPHAHLEAIVQGRGGEEEYLTVSFRTLVGASLAAFADEEGKQTLEKEVFLPALGSLIAVGERYERLGKFGCNGDELGQLKAALNLTDDLQAATTRRQQLEMYQQVQGFVGGIQFTLNNLRLLKDRYQ